MRTFFDKGFIFSILIFSAIWILLGQFFFVAFQRDKATSIVYMLNNQLRQELDYGNFQYLARSATDFVQSGAVKCITIKQLRPKEVEIINLSYMQRNCSPSEFSLEGLVVTTQLSALNGALFSFSFLSSNDSIFYIALWVFRLLGIVFIVSISFVSRLQLSFKKRIEINEMVTSQKMYESALQVAHDIRSPLSVLKILENKLVQSDSEVREIFNEAIGRIEKIASDLLDQKKSADFNSSQSRDNLKSISLVEGKSLFKVVEQVFREKKLLWAEFSNVKISLFAEVPDIKNIMAVFDSTKLARILSNLMNNAFESLTADSGEIELAVTFLSKDKVRLSITDNGVGIDPEHLKILGNKRFSFGKEKSKQSGSGLGLFDARQNIESWGGRMEIRSKLGEGTIIEIYLLIA